ncbi:Aminotran_1_2 domain-containing protein [Cephalotus follicularis]|uniref:Aminotran_1_2 domain-containing protein n=1 Tax=Cephalotus follicularis TaxID=3775 RepID=A0A1Q3BKX4_CEPFO|nr:Aminotran_1_2 domain-containing protein [Cephalotus follicularis]
MKLNLGVGGYRTKELQPYVLKVIQKSENLTLEMGKNKKYLSIEGLAAFNKVTAELLFGVDNAVIQKQRVCTSCGRKSILLRCSAALIERYFPREKVLISSPICGVYCQLYFA